LRRSVHQQARVIRNTASADRRCSLVHEAMALQREQGRPDDPATN